MSFNEASEDWDFHCISPLLLLVAILTFLRYTRRFLLAFSPPFASSVPGEVSE
jgi:hypothetical protein